MQQVQPEELLALTRKHKHSYSVSIDPFTSLGRDFLIYNISLKKDYKDDFDYVNCRRGLSYIQQIIDYKHCNLTVARKGLRKFKDLLPEYLEIKQSHLSTSGYHCQEKQRMIRTVEQTKGEQFVLYNTDKMNGENAQISFVYGCLWVVGSKNKTLLVGEEQELDGVKSKHEHKLTILIARSWFNLLKGLSEEMINELKEELSRYTLVGEYCNSENLQHLVDYGKQPQLYFYALVAKNDKINTCQATSSLIRFCNKYSLTAANYTMTNCVTSQQILSSLKQLVMDINQQPMSQKGQGSVVYLTSVNLNIQRTILVVKIKTVQYRIYRKLREKLKIYLEKFNKGYGRLLKKFEEEIGELGREVELGRPIDRYVEVARRAFQLCEDQNRALSRLIGNRFITFLRVVVSGVGKEEFLKMLKEDRLEIGENQNWGQLSQDKAEREQKSKIEENVAMEQDVEMVHKDKIEEKVDIKQKKQKKPTKQSKIKSPVQKQLLSKQQIQKPLVLQPTKKLLVLIPLTLPSTGKSTLFKRMLLLSQQANLHIEIISSDSARRQIMQQKMRKTKTMSKKQAYQKSRKQGNELYYRKMDQAGQQLATGVYNNCVLFLDKNHPQNALKQTIKQIKTSVQRWQCFKVKLLAVLPQISQPIAEKGKYSYPFDYSYILTCLQRVIMRYMIYYCREQHQTLQGSVEDRVRVVVGFANLFRNFSLGGYNLKKYFDGKLGLRFHQCRQKIEEDVEKVLRGVLLAGKPGNFDEVPGLDKLVEMMKEVKMVEPGKQELVEEGLKRIQKIFEMFEDIGLAEREQ